jgi:hypothetical protein
LVGAKVNNFFRKENKKVWKGELKSVRCLVVYGVSHKAAAFHLPICGRFITAGSSPINAFRARSREPVGSKIKGM